MADLIKNAIYTRLSGYSGLTDLVSTRIWPDKARQGAARPYLTFHRITTENTHAMGGDITPTEIRLQVTCVADDGPSCDEIARQVKAALSRYRGTVATVVIQAIYFLDQIDLWSDADQVYRINQDYRVFFEE